jgi:hypothetical protein
MTVTPAEMRDIALALRRAEEYDDYVGLAEEAAEALEFAADALDTPVPEWAFAGKDE